MRLFRCALFTRKAFRCSEEYQCVRSMATQTSKKPKPPKDTLRHVRMKENRRQGDLHGPATVYVQVLGAGSRDNGPSLYVFSEYNRLGYRLYNVTRFKKTNVSVSIIHYNKYI